MFARLLTRLIAAQAPWAGPFGDFNHRWLRALLGRMQGVKDFLNGTWLGHSLHAALTDLPIGALTVVVVLDVLDERTGADIALGVAVISMLAAAAAGAADYTDTGGHPRMVATVHATLMVLALLISATSMALRLGTAADRSLPVALDIVAYLVVLAGAYVGGHVVYALGNMVSRHAWRFSGAPAWQALDLTDIPEGRLVKATAGEQPLVLVREGETIHALHEQCAHAGGPLSEGTIVDGCIQCPWHASRYELVTGSRRSGPTTHDQPQYKVRRAGPGGYEAIRVRPGTAAPERTGETSP